MSKTCRETFTGWFSRSEILLEKGAIDPIIDRRWTLRDKMHGILQKIAHHQTSTNANRPPFKKRQTGSLVHEQWRAILAKFIPRYWNGLERVCFRYSKLLQLDFACKTVITVAGTNGKGTTGAMIAAGPCCCKTKTGRRYLALHTIRLSRTSQSAGQES